MKNTTDRHRCLVEGCGIYFNAGWGCPVHGWQASETNPDFPWTWTQPSFQHEGPPAEGKKASNPKDIIGAGKAPLELVPDTLRVAASMAFLEGALKYGRYNWRLAGVRASIYKAALDRHMASWWNGEDIDEQSGLPHLWKAAACIAILIDAAEVDKLTDDRPPRADLTAMIERIIPDVARLKALHADKSPHQCVLADSPEPEIVLAPKEMGERTAVSRKIADGTEPAAPRAVGLRAEDLPWPPKPGQKFASIGTDLVFYPLVAPGCGVDAPRPHIDEAVRVGQQRLSSGTQVAVVGGVGHKPGATHLSGGSMNSGHFNPGTVVTYQPDGSEPEVFFALYNKVTKLTRYIRAANGTEAAKYLHRDGEVLLPQTFTLQPVA